MCRMGIVLFIGVAICMTYSNFETEGALLSSLLSPALEKKDKSDKSLARQGRSYYDHRSIRPYDRQTDDGGRCSRCLDDRYDRDDYDRRDRDRDSYDDDRRTNRPTSGSRYDRNEEDDRKYNTDRRNGKNETDSQDGDKKDKDGDSRPSGSRRHGDRDRDRGRDRDRDRYDDRDRYRPDYYDRYLRDPYDRDYYNRHERRPLFDRYPSYDDYGGRYDGYGYSGYRRPVYDDRYDRGYDDVYGGYGPGVGRGPHDSFRPWDETYRGQAGWDAGGRGYYFASGRPDTASAQAWGRPQYVRPESSWQSVDSSYRDQVEYRGSVGYPEYGYRQEVSAGYGRPSGWQSVGESRPYRDQSGVINLDKKTKYDYDSLRNNQYGRPGQPDSFQPSGASHSTSTTQRSYLFQRQDEEVTVKSTDIIETPKST